MIELSKIVYSSILCLLVSNWLKLEPLTLALLFIFLFIRKRKMFEVIKHLQVQNQKNTIQIWTWKFLLLWPPLQLPEKMRRKEFDKDQSESWNFEKLIVILFINQSRHEPSHNRLGKGGQTSPLPISKYFSEFFSPSHIKLTNKTRIWTLNRSSDRRNWRILN